MRRRRNRYRPDKAKRKRLIRHWFLVFSGILMLLLTTFLLSIGLAQAYHALLDSDWFKVEEIQIFGLKHVTRDEILEAMMLPSEANLLNLKASQIAARVESLPWLRSAEVSFKLPGTVLVEVSEREPLAVIHADEFLLMDEDGKMVSRASPEDLKNFIICGGFSGSGLKEGEILPQDRLRVLKSLLTALGRCGSWLPVSSIAECRWDAETGYSLAISHKNIPIRLGWRHFDQKLERLKRIFALLEERQMWNVVIGIDLDYSNHAVIEGLTPFSRGG